jgi:hypothetical protein
MKAQLKAYAFWYDNFNELIFKSMGESDACLFLAACAYCSVNTALDQNILEAAKLYLAVTQDFTTEAGRKALQVIATTVKSNLTNKDLAILSEYAETSAYAKLLLPKKDFEKIAKGPKQGQDDIFNEVTVGNAKIPNFHRFVNYYLEHNGKVTKSQLYQDLESGTFTIGGTKINSFLLNLVFPGTQWAGKIDPATVDRWMIRVFFDEPLKDIVDHDVRDWIQHLNDASTQTPLSPEDARALAKKEKALDKKKADIVNSAVMQLFGKDVIRQNLVKILHDEARKIGLTSYQLQALAWVNIRKRYNEPAAKFSKFEDVMAYAEEAAQSVKALDPNINPVMRTLKILASGPRFKFTNPQQVVSTIQNADKYEAIYKLPPKVKKDKTGETVPGSTVDYTKMKVGLVRDGKKADIYDLSRSKKTPVQSVTGTNKRETLKNALDWILTYQPA